MGVGEERASVARTSSGSVERTGELGAALAALLRAGDVVELVGDLGAGKTHFVKGVARGLGVADEITSPTFNILKIYEGFERAPLEAPSRAGDPPSPPLRLAHWDLYRLEDPDELDDVDFFGIIEEPDVVSLIEWGDKFPDAMPEDRLRVDIRLGAPGLEGDDARTIEATGFGTRGRALADAYGAAW